MRHEAHEQLSITIALSITDNLQDRTSFAVSNFPLSRLHSTPALRHGSTPPKIHKEIKTIGCKLERLVSNQTKASAFKDVACSITRKKNVMGVSVGCSYETRQVANSLSVYSPISHA